mmetsp:Transcript_35103/g.99906  ORF Transcript_35103/g.99906 Transcript_35103/m.99906 type:complete len:204 (+) Transcript_35103:878-1489(+)
MFMISWLPSSRITSPPAAFAWSPRSSRKASNSKASGPRSSTSPVCTSTTLPPDHLSCSSMTPTPRNTTLACCKSPCKSDIDMTGHSAALATGPSPSPLSPSPSPRASHNPGPSASAPSAGEVTSRRWPRKPSSRNAAATVGPQATATQSDCKSKGGRGTCRQRRAASCTWQRRDIRRGGASAQILGDETERRGECAPRAGPKP